MAEIPNEENLDNVRQAGADYLDILRQQTAAMKELAKSLRGNAEAQASISNETRRTTDLTQKLSSFSKESLKDGRKRAAFEKNYRDAKAEQLSLEKQIQTALNKGTDASKKQARILQDQLDTSRAVTEEAFKLTEAYQELDKKVKFFEDMADLVNEIPVLRKLFPEIKKAAEAARDAAAENKSAWKAASEYLGGALTKAISVLTIGLIKKGLGQIDEQITKLNRSLNLTTEQSRLFYRNLQLSKNFTSTELIKSAVELNKELGTSATITLKQAETFSVLTERMGIAASSASQLFSFAAATGKSFQELNTELIGSVKYQNALSGRSVDYKAVMEDVAQAGAATRLSLQQFPGGIVKAAYEARKLGLNLSQLEKTAGGLLDFESSIEAELEAEILSGREFNLERARALALTNDLTGLNEELAAQNITQAKFANANRLEQEAMAGMLNMSREEMAQMFEKQAAIERVSKEDLTTRERIQYLLNSGLSVAEATAAVGVEEFEYRKQQMTMQERMNVLQDKLLGLAERFYPVIDAINGVMDLLVKGGQALYKVLLAITLLKFGGFNKLGNAIQTAANNAKNLQKSATAASTASSEAAKAAAKSTTANTAKAAAESGAKLTSKQVASGFGGKAAKTALEQTGKVLTQKQIAAGFGGKAAQQLATAGTDVAAQTGKGLFGRIIQGGKNLVGKLNPMNALGTASTWLGKNLPKFIKNMKGIPLLASAIEGIFAKGDIEAIIAGGGTEESIYQAIGKRSLQALGSIGGGLIGGSLGSLIPIPGIGTALGAFLGDSAGRWLTGWLADNTDMSGFGRKIGETFFSEDLKAIKSTTPETVNQETPVFMATGGILTQPTNIVAGEAGAEAVIPLREFYAKFDELISTFKQGGNVYMDSMKVGHSTAIGNSRLG